MCFGVMSKVRAEALNLRLNLAAGAFRPGGGVACRPFWLTRQVVSRPAPEGELTRLLVPDRV